MSTVKTLVVLAAGMGSRYGGLKQIDPVGPNGEKVIDYSIFDARRAGFTRVVFVIREEMEQAFRESIGDAVAKHMDVAYAYQSLNDVPGGRSVPAGREKPWGTGHAAYAARHVVNGPFAVVNADDFYGREAYELMAGFLDRAGEHQYAMVAYELVRTASEHGTVARGICRADEQDRLITIEEVTTIEKADGKLISKESDGSVRTFADTTPASMNLWGFTPDVFDELERRFASFVDAKGGEPKAEYYLSETVGHMIADGTATVTLLYTSGDWFGVTYKEDKPSVVAGIQRLIDAGDYPAVLWND